MDHEIAEEAEAEVLYVTLKGIGCELKLASK